MRDIKLLVDDKTNEVVKTQLKNCLGKYKDSINNHLYTEIYEELSLDKEIMGIAISYFTKVLLSTTDLYSFLKNIPDYFLTCTDIENFDIPDNYAFVGKKAFYNCGNLITITIPSSIKHIKEGAFGGCKNLKTIYYNGTQKEFDDIVVDKDNIEFISAKVQFI